VKTYVLIIKPESPFGTLLKGDTLFGHFCWQAAEDPSLLHDGLGPWVAKYCEQPFAVFSSAFPVLQEAEETILCPRPLQSLPVGEKNRRQQCEQRKVDKKRKWLVVPKSLRMDWKAPVFASEAEAFQRFVQTAAKEEARQLRLLPSTAHRLSGFHEQSHNAINRLTMTTGTGPFAPFSHENLHFLPGLRLVILAGVEEDALDAEQLKRGVERIGMWGFGRDASTGLGRFRVESLEEIIWPEITANHEACYTLAPCVPQKGTMCKCLAVPFTRFGRHGASLATSNRPYKNPVVMADEGALLYPSQALKTGKPYVGTGLTGLSKADTRTISQGYSLFLPY